MIGIMEEMDEGYNGEDEYRYGRFHRSGGLGSHSGRGNGSYGGYGRGQGGGNGYGHGGPMHSSFRNHRAGFGLKYFILAFAENGRIRGVDIMNRVEDVSRGYWRPVPGHVYYELDRLVKEGYLKIVNEDGNKYYEITEEGRKFLNYTNNWLPIRAIIAKGLAPLVKKDEGKASSTKERIREEIHNLESSGNLSPENKATIEKLKKLLEEL
ncbi:MAG: helix-turn-helix transcriptional regulator [Candidatus Micrarchaeia archaeon]